MGGEAARCSRRAPPERYFEGLTEVVRLSDEGETTFLIEYDIHFIAEQQRWRP